MIHRAGEAGLDVVCMQEVRFYLNLRESPMKHARSLGWTWHCHVERLARVTGIVFGGVAILSRCLAQALATPDNLVPSDSIQMVRVHLAGRGPILIANVHLSRTCRVTRVEMMKQLVFLWRKSVVRS